MDTSRREGAALARWSLAATTNAAQALSQLPQLKETTYAHVANLPS
ncbi:hypothetical protein [Nostoc sp.]